MGPEESSAATMALFAGPLDDLLREEQRLVDLEPERVEDLPRITARLRADGLEVETRGSTLRVWCDPERSPDLHRSSVELGVALRRLVPQSETLEDVFLRMTGGDPETEGAPA